MPWSATAPRSRSTRDAGRMTVDIVYEDDRWRAAGLSGLAERGASAALTHLGLKPEEWEIACLACDDARIAELNADFRGKPQPTNVLSWPAEDPDGNDVPVLPEHGPELGDLALAYETCLREAEEGGLSLADHVTHLVVHGTLHLLGYDHIDDADAEIMERMEVEILATLGIADPY